MKMQGQICSRGIWDETIPGITYDQYGESNYAKLFDNLCEAYPRGKTGENEWSHIVKQIIKQGNKKEYDCIIRVSGGTDSSYLLHIAKSRYGLRPLAVNLDNGWNSSIAVKNIKKMTDALDIDLYTYVIDYEEIKDLFLSYMRAGLPWIDMPSDIAIKAVLYKIAARERVKYILRGNDFRSEGSQPNEWTYGDGRQLNYIHKKFGRIKLKTFPNYTISSLILYGIFKRIKSIYPYYYLDYNKKQAQEFLKNNYSWEYYGGHHHENLFTKFAIAYWLYEKYNIDKRKITLSAQILSGEIEREGALSEIEKTPYGLEEKENIINYVIKKLGITTKEFDILFNAKKHSYLDYPSYDYLFTKYFKYVIPIMKLVFIHKPQSIFQYEMRNN